MKDWKFWLKQVIIGTASLGAFVGLVFLSVAATDHRKQLECTGTIVNIDYSSGLSFVNVEEVDSLLLVVNGIRPSLSHLADLPLPEMERRLEKNPWIHSAEVYLRQDGKLQADIVQKRPLFRVINTSAVGYYICRDKSKMPLNSNFTSQVTVVGGWLETGDPQRDSLVFANLFFLQESLEKDSFLLAMTDQILIDEQGEFKLIPISGGHQVRIGNTDRLEDKLSSLKTFYREGMVHTGWNKYGLVDLRFSGQVVCRKKQALTDSIETN